MLFICTPHMNADGSIQINDLFPHKTQSNATVTPRFLGPIHIVSSSPKTHDLPSLDANFDLEADASGLIVYILATIEEVNTNVAPTVLEAKAIADKILLRVSKGLSLTEDDLDTIIESVMGAGNELESGNNVASLDDILKIVSGYEIFTLVSTFSIAGANNAFEGLNGVATADFFSAPSNESRLITELSASAKISARNGQLSRAINRTDENGVSAPLVVIYNSDGSLFQ